MEPLKYLLNNPFTGLNNPGPSKPSDPGTGGISSGWLQPLSDELGFLASGAAMQGAQLVGQQEPTGNYEPSYFNTDGNRLAYDPAELALIDSQIQSVNDAMGRFDNQRSIGKSNIENSYTEAQNNLNSQKGLADRDYNLQVDRTGQDYVNSRGAIGNDAGNQYRSLQRLFGASGAGRSSAAKILAPFAVGRQASQRFGQVQDTFGRNRQSQDIAYGDVTKAYDDQGKELARQRELKLNELEQGILSNEAELRNQLGQLGLQRQQLIGGNMQDAVAALEPHQTRISEILNAIDNLGAQYSNSVAPTGVVQYAAPELGTYNYSRFDRPAMQGAVDPRADYVTPFTRLLRDEEER